MIVRRDDREEVLISVREDPIEPTPLPAASSRRREWGLRAVDKAVDIEGVREEAGKSCLRVSREIRASA